MVSLLIYIKTYPTDKKKSLLTFATFIFIINTYTKTYIKLVILLISYIDTVAKKFTLLSDSFASIERFKSIVIRCLNPKVEQNKLKD